MDTEPVLEREELLREAISAIAMAYAPATDVPRERAVMRSALASLVQSYGEATFTASEASDAIRHHGTLIELRDNYSREILELLVGTGSLNRLPGDEIHYEVSEPVRRDIDRAHREITDLIDRVVLNLFGEQTDKERDRLRDDLLCCVARVMAAFGGQYAHQVAGLADGPVVISGTRLLALCEEALGANGERSKIVASAIAELYASDDPHFARFVFLLAQNYYYLRLLGLAGGLEYFSEKRFAGSEMFLDTNLLFAFLFPESRHHRSILELSELALRLKISFHVTEATLDELARVLIHHRVDLAKAFDAVPDELAHDVRSIVFRAYRLRKQANPDLTAEEFFTALEHPRDVLRSDWGIEVLDHDIESEIDDQELKQIKQALADASASCRRGRRKGDGALAHDAHLFLLVRTERESYGDRTAWILTLDTSLAPAARKLQGEADRPYAMSLDGFLQVLSPYVRADKEQSFAENFLRVVRRNLFPPTEIIELDDFRMFTDFDLSVRKLDPVDVRSIIRRVRDAVGGDLRGTDRKRVAYEVQKALADPTLKYKAALEADVSRLELELKKAIADADARERLAEAKHASELATDRARSSAEVGQLRSDLQAMGAEVAKMGEAASARDADHVAQREKLDRSRHRTRTIAGTALAFVLVAAAWFSPSTWPGFVSHGWGLRAALTALVVVSAVGIWRRFGLLATAGLAIAAAGLLFTIGSEPVTEPRPPVATPPAVHGRDASAPAAGPRTGSAFDASAPLSVEPPSP